MCIRDSPKGIPHRWQESGSPGLPGNDGVGLIPPFRGGSPEPPLFGIWVSRGFLRPSPTGYGKRPPCVPRRLEPPTLPCNLSLIHISEPTRLLSISYAVFCLKKKK